MKSPQLQMAAGYSPEGEGPIWIAMTGGAGLMLVLASTVAWKTWQFWTVREAWPLLGLTLLAFGFAALVSGRLRLLPKAEGIGVLIGVVTLVFVLVVTVTALWRLYYSRSFLLVAFVVAAVWLPLVHFSGVGARKVVLALVPGGMSTELLTVEGIVWHLLKQPEYPAESSGIAVDLHQRLDAAWIRFLADCAVRRIPVYHAAVVYEAATGRVSLSHLQSGLFEEWRPSLGYMVFKRVAEVAVILLLLPVVLAICLLLALAIRLDSSGPVIFAQQRVGLNGRIFSLYKFRSMRHVANVSGASFTDAADDRITRVGRIIRTCRLDELPQLWNVLKGEMSLVGPRPEQVPYAAHYSQEIPFYSYRHLVRPGISGWAQVNHGYAANFDETRAKLEFDLYYVKYLSFWLDLIILMRTLRIVLTGFGAR